MVDLLGLAGLLDRRPRTLSGGERQRVAVGRALLARPRMLLMDEPLASLDAARKAEILPFLLRLHRAAPIPIVYVTHAIDEVVQLATTLVLLEDGRCIGCGPIAAILADAGMAGRADAQALLDGRVVAHDPQRRLSRVEAGGFALLVPLCAQAVGSPLRLGVPAREVILLAGGSAPPVTSAQNVLPARVREIRPLDDAGLAAVVLEPDGEGAGPVILARITADSVQRLGLRPGLGVLALVKSVSIMVPDGGGA